MSQHIHCDGCGIELGPFRAEPRREQRLIHGERDKDSGQGLHPIPNGEFDWCEDCAKIAFAAVKAAAGRACRFCGRTHGLEIIHKDGEPQNNDLSNLDVRCHAHRYGARSA